MQQQLQQLQMTVPIPALFSVRWTRPASSALRRMVLASSASILRPVPRLRAYCAPLLIWRQTSIGLSHLRMIIRQGQFVTAMTDAFSTILAASSYARTWLFVSIFSLMGTTRKKGGIFMATSAAGTWGYSSSMYWRQSSMSTGGASAQSVEASWNWMICLGRR